MKHNIIGDIHGRTSWKGLVDLSAVNVFVGDYFDPYEDEGMRSYESVRDNFLDIIELKRNNPDKVVLLYGNHDFHYIYDGDEYSRFDELHCAEIQSLFKQFEYLFHGICYSNGNYIVSHAGISREWYNRCFGKYDNNSVNDIENKINFLWHSDLAEESFCFDRSNFLDFDGSAPTQSPIWIRPETLLRHNLFCGSDVIQVVGHTFYPGSHIIDADGIVIVDVLGSFNESFRF